MSAAPVVDVRRGVTHPWKQQEQGWDRLHLSAPSHDHLERLVMAARLKHWRVWHVDHAELVAILYKPSGQDQAWKDDISTWKHDYTAVADLMVGDVVYTDFDNGRISKHRVLDIRRRSGSQSGLMLIVDPPPRGSSVPRNDPGASPASDCPVLDAGWFRKLL